MSAPIRDYYEYDRNASISCSACGWSGICSENEGYFSEVLDVRCGACDKMLLIVGYPTHDQTRAAAAEGNERAQADMENVVARESFFARAEEHALTSPSQLPDLEDEDLVIDWDFEDREDSGNSWTILRHKGQAIWREIAFYEGIDRFEEVLWLLREKYGGQLAELKPTSASNLYLCGDDFGASSRIDSLNAELKRLRKPVGEGFYVDVEDADGDPDDPERQRKELLAAVEEIGTTDCSCGWIGEASNATVSIDGGQGEVKCPVCRRPLFRLGAEGE